MPEIVITKDKRTAVLFHVSRSDVREPRQIFAKKPGRFAMRGAWYGARGQETKRPNLRSQKAFGKVHGDYGRVIGRVPAQPSPYLLRKLT